MFSEKQQTLWAWAFLIIIIIIFLLNPVKYNLFLRKLWQFEQSHLLNEVILRLVVYYIHIALLNIRNLMPGQRFRLLFEAYFYNILNLIILLNDAMRQAVLSSFHLLTLSKRNSLTFFSFWHIIYSYRRTFQHIHVHIMIYSNVFSPHFLILIFWFLVTEMSSQLLCPSRIGKRRRKGLSLFKGCCCPPFLMRRWCSRGLEIHFCKTLQSMVCL